MGTLSNPLPGTFTYNNLSDEELGTGSLFGTSFARRPGIYNVAVTGILSTVDASIHVGLTLQGSNDNINWLEIAAMDAADRLSTVNRGGCIAFSTGGVVPVGRFRYLRVAAEGLNLANDWTMDVLVGGAQHPGTHFQYTPDTVVRAAETENSDTITRPHNVRMMTVQAVFGDVDLGAAASFDIVAQMSVDGSDWITVNLPTSIVANGDVLIPGAGGSVTIDWGGFNYLRFQITDEGGVGTSYNCILYVDMDSKDWQAYESPAGGSSGGGALGAQVEIPDVSGAAGDVAVAVQLTDSAGLPLVGNYNLVLVLSDTQWAGDVDLAGVHQFNGIDGGVGTMVAGDTSNRCAVHTNVAGLVQVSVNDNGAGASNVYLHAQSAGVPNSIGSGLIVAQSDECTVNFT